MLPRTKKVLLKRLFFASLLITALCAAAWWASNRRSFALARRSPKGRIEFRVRRGCIYLTSAENPMGKVAGWTWISEPLVAADSWPELAISSIWPRITYRYDPRDTAFLGFICISRPTIDIVAVPFWAPIAALAIYQAWWLANGRLQRGRFAAGHCVNCGYDLRGLESLCCPECGRQFTWGKVQALPATAERHRAHPHVQQRAL